MLQVLYKTCGEAGYVMRSLAGPTSRSMKISRPEGGHYWLRKEPAWRLSSLLMWPLCLGGVYSSERLSLCDSCNDLAVAHEMCILSV